MHEIGGDLLSLDKLVWYYGSTGRAFLLKRAEIGSEDIRLVEK